jgi:hypothetical protein
MRERMVESVECALAATVKWSVTSVAASKISTLVLLSTFQ